MQRTVTLKVTKKSWVLRTPRGFTLEGLQPLEDRCLISVEQGTANRRYVSGEVQAAHSS